jgi:serine/threonine protein kinase
MLTPAALTQAGAAIGTPLCMSPEQCRGEPLDARSDIYKPRQIGFSFELSGRSSLYQRLSVFITLLTAIMLAELYLKTRGAGGETLADAAERLDALEIPRSRWQTRMRSRER